jgi:hypothetical protein
MEMQRVVHWVGLKVSMWADLRASQLAESMVVRTGFVKAGRTAVSMAVKKVELKAGAMDVQTAGRLVEQLVAKMAALMALMSVGGKGHRWADLLVAQTAVN